MIFYTFSQGRARWFLIELKVNLLKSVKHFFSLISNYACHNFPPPTTTLHFTFLPCAWESREVLDFNQINSRKLGRFNFFIFKRVKLLHSGKWVHCGVSWAPPCIWWNGDITPLHRAHNSARTTPKQRDALRGITWIWWVKNILYHLPSNEAFGNPQLSFAKARSWPECQLVRLPCGRWEGESHQSLERSEKMACLHLPAHLHSSFLPLFWFKN